MLRSTPILFYLQFKKKRQGITILKDPNKQKQEQFELSARTFAHSYTVEYTYDGKCDQLNMPMDKSCLLTGWGHIGNYKA